MILQFYAFFYLIRFLSFPFTKTEKTDNPSSFDWTEKNYFVVEQLEPKILLSAAPIDAPIDSLDVVSEESNERFSTSEATFSNDFFVEEKIENRDEVEIEEEYLFSQAESIDFVGFESGATNEIDVAVNAVVNEEGILHIKENDILKGAGIINGHIINEGLISPGYSPGLIQDRAMTLEEGGVLLIELGGTDINQFDRIVVDEEVNLGGKLEVELIDGYSPNVGDEFEFMNFGESFSDFSEMSGLDLGDGLYLMPTLGLSSYKLRVVDSSPQDAVVSFNSNDDNDPNDGSIRIDTGDVFLNDLYESVFSNIKSLSEISDKNFIGTVTIGAVEVSGHFETGQNGDFAYLLMKNGSVFVESNADTKIFDGTSSGLRISKAKVAVLFDPGDKGFAMIGSGYMKSYASGLDLEGSIQIKWNKTGQTIDNLNLNIGSNAHTLYASKDVASIIGDVSLESDLANMNVSLGVQLSNYNQSKLTVKLSHGSINFSSSLRSQLSLDDINGTLSMMSDGEFITNLSGVLKRAYFNGFELSQINVELDYLKSSSDETQFIISSQNETNSINLSDVPIQSGFEFFASQDDVLGKQFVFSFSNININSDELRVKDGSGVLIADSRGVAAILYGTASAGFQNTGTPFSSEAKLKLSP